MLILKNRTLYPCGISDYDPIYLAKKIFETGTIPEGAACLDMDGRLYDTVYNTSLAKHSEPDLMDYPVHNNNHNDDDLNELYDLCTSSKRYREDMEDRLLEELDFFDRTNNILFLLEIHKLIGRFREDGVVWGVGRGSACASLIFYLIEVHDIDPTKFDIDFSELSKED